jgi:hypothetical protein
MGTSKNLKEAAAQYIRHLEETGQKPSTVGTARRTLDLLIADMGEGKVVDKILPVHTAAFFKSEAATMQPGKDGPRPRAQASLLQIRRIVRAALVWCHEQGWTKTVALPATEKGFLEGRKSRRAKAAETGEPAATTESAVPAHPAATPNPEPVKAAAPRPAITLADEPTNE